MIQKIRYEKSWNCQYYRRQQTGNQKLSDIRDGISKQTPVKQSTGYEWKLQPWSVIITGCCGAGVNISNSLISPEQIKNEWNKYEHLGDTIFIQVKFFLYLELHLLNIFLSVFCNSFIKPICGPFTLMSKSSNSFLPGRALQSLFRCSPGRCPRFQWTVRYIRHPASKDTRIYICLLLP